VEKTQEGGLNCVFKNCFFLSKKHCSQDQSLNRVQSLSVQRIRTREQEKEENTNNLYRFLPQSGSSLVPLALPRRVPLKCNIKLQVAQTHK